MTEVKVTWLGRTSEASVQYLAHAEGQVQVGVECALVDSKSVLSGQKHVDQTQGARVPAAYVSYQNADAVSCSDG